MKKVLIIALTFVMVLSFCVNIFAADSTVKIDMDKTYQTIDGFGASYTWYSERLVNNVDAETGYDWIFNDTEFNILRFRDLNRVGDNHQDAENGYPVYYAYYSEAIERGIDPIVLVTSWGDFDRDLEWLEYVEAPNGRTYFTLAKDENGEYMYNELAEFFVQSMQYFYDAGIDVDYFSISNEVELQERREDENGNARDAAGFFLGQDEDENHCAYWKAHIAVYEAFQEAFGEYAPILLGAETMAANPKLLHGYLDPVIENCPESLEIVAHHLYGTDLSEKNLTNVGEAFADYRIWQTEWYNKNYFEHAEVVMDSLICENVNAYLYWSGVWQPNMGSCIIEVEKTDPESKMQRMGNHYIMMHFSKFIKRGYQRVDVSDELGSKVAAFKSPDEGKLVVVAMNPTELDEYMELDIGVKAILGSQVWLSTEGESEYGFDNKYMQDMGQYNGELLVPARSLMTVEIDLTPNPDYIAPIIEKRVNPFVKEIENGAALSPIMITVIACIAIVVIVVVITAIIFTKKKKTVK